MSLTGGWGDDGLYQKPVFVVTHRPHGRHDRGRRPGSRGGRRQAGTHHGRREHHPAGRPRAPQPGSDGGHRPAAPPRGETAPTRHRPAQQHLRGEVGPVAPHTVHRTLRTSAQLVEDLHSRQIHRHGRGARRRIPARDRRPPSPPSAARCREKSRSCAGSTETIFGFVDLVELPGRAHGRTRPDANGSGRSRSPDLPSADGREAFLRLVDGGDLCDDLAG